MAKLAETKIELMRLKMAKGFAPPPAASGTPTVASLTPKISTPSWLGGGAAKLGGLFSRATASTSAAAPAAVAAAATATAATAAAAEEEGDGVVMLTAEASRAFNEIALRAVYAVHVPDKLPRVVKLAEKYAGQSDVLLTGLRNKYGTKECNALIDAEVGALPPLEGGGDSSAAHEAWRDLREKV
jgi:hypothetical protein